MSNPDATKERVLVVEDEADLSSSLAYALRTRGYEVEIADRGETAIQGLDGFKPDLVLLDIMLPDISGLEICKKVRGTLTGPQPAIIILSARAQEIDRVVGLEVGADDYVVKPFSARELMLRIEARLKVRRAALEAMAKPPTSVPAEPPGVFSLRNLRVEETAHRVLVDDREIHVSALEMRVLLYLLRSPGRMRTRKKLLTEVWGYNPEVQSRTVDTHIKRLRDKLGTAADLLQTVRGVGFRLADPDRPLSREEPQLPDQDSHVTTQRSAAGSKHYQRHDG
jgi:two-component system phosphate regulon response regulator PhoB